MSTLKFTILSNIETTLPFSTLNWTALDNVKDNTVIFTVYFHNVGQRRNKVANMTICKKRKKRLDSKTKQYFWASKNMLDSKFSSFFPILRGTCKRTFQEPQKFIKHRICWVTKSIFKPSHFVKCQLVSKGKFGHIIIIPVLILYVF